MLRCHPREALAVRVLRHCGVGTSERLMMRRIQTLKRCRRRHRNRVAVAITTAITTTRAMTRASQGHHVAIAITEPLVGQVGSGRSGWIWSIKLDLVGQVWYIRYIGESASTLGYIPNTRNYPNYLFADEIEMRYQSLRIPSHPISSQVTLSTDQT